MTPDPAFTQGELLRYSRHLLLPEVGIEGQGRLREGRVLLVGAGGLGSPAALYLAAAGVGTLGLVDGDRVDASNLQRQVLHGTGSIGAPKVESAAARLRDLNPHVRIEQIDQRLTSVNALEILRPWDVIVDGSDNFPTRYLVNDACILLGKPDVYGSIHRFEGQVSVFDAGRGPCYRCLFAEPPPPGLVPSCAEAGVLGVLPGIIGSLQALEALKLLLGVGRSLVGRLVLFEALPLTFREVAIRKDPACPACAGSPTITSLIDYEAFCGLPGNGGSAADDVDPLEVATRLTTDPGSVQIVDVREPAEIAIAVMPHARPVPLGELGARITELDPGTPIVTVCHKGSRSRAAAELLRAAGFSARSLAGGIDAWAREVDPSLARY